MYLRSRVPDQRCEEGHAAAYTSYAGLTCVCLLPALRVLLAPAALCPARTEQFRGTDWNSRLTPT